MIQNKKKYEELSSSISQDGNVVKLSKFQSFPNRKNVLFKCGAIKKTDKKIRLATCFSGIGAIEHALKRLRLNTEIVFACDNGDVDILSKEIPLNIDDMNAEFSDLNSIISELKGDDYKVSLENELKHNSYLFSKQLDSLNSINLEIEKDVLSIFSFAIKNQNVKKIRRKEYTSFYDKLQIQTDANKKLYLLQCLIEIENDFHKDNNYESLYEEKNELKSKDNMDWNSLRKNIKNIYDYINEINGRRLLKDTKDISERLGMLHERLHTLKIKEELNKIDSFDERKQLVDNLYKNHQKQNQVKKSYLANYDLDERNFHWNVSFVDGNEYKDNVDLFVGGSPCQSFSLVGKQRGLEDTRGTLFYEYARLVSEIHPKVFIYENVKAILSNDEGRTWQTISKIFDELGYDWKFKVLNAKDYGIPQHRERLFVVGFRKDLHLEKEFSFPNPEKLETTMKDFLLDNVSGKYYLPTKGVNFVTSKKNLTKRYTQIDGDIALCQKKNQQFNWHGDFIFEAENKDKEKTIKDLEKYFLSEKVKKYVLSTGTKGFYSKPKIDLDVARPLLTTMHKMHRAGVDNYVTTDGRLRKLTPRECLRLMGFCDSFKIVVSDTSMYQQSGNSIVVNVLMSIVNEILKSYPYLEG